MSITYASTIPLFEMVSSIMTMEITDVVQVGITSMIHIRAVNTKIAMVLCITGVRPSMPKNEVGTAQRIIVNTRTMPSAIQFFFDNLVVLIFNIIGLLFQEFLNLGSFIFIYL